MTTPRTMRSRLRCEGCGTMRARSAFDRLPNGVRNTYCAQCVQVQRLLVAGRQRVREVLARERAAKASWEGRS